MQEWNPPVEVSQTIPKEDVKGRCAPAPGSAIRDTFRGDNKLLRECIKALIELNDSNSLVPHGIGGHARTLLSACYRRLPNDRGQARREQPKT
jgi:hypothetical protein